MATSFIEEIVCCVLVVVDQLGVLESVKAAADIYSPVGGTVAEVNSSLGEKPELVNKDSYSDGKHCSVCVCMCGGHGCVVLLTGASRAGMWLSGDPVMVTGSCVVCCLPSVLKQTFLQQHLWHSDP